MAVFVDDDIVSCVVILLEVNGCVVIFDVCNMVVGGVVRIDVCNMVVGVVVLIDVCNMVVGVVVVFTVCITVVCVVSSVLTVVGTLVESVSKKILAV